MNEERIERLLDELESTRKTFEAAGKTFETAVKQIKWNKINTIIQYTMLVVVGFMLIFGFFYYLRDKKAACQRGNQTRTAIQVSLDNNARAIGIALVIVADVPQEEIPQILEEYMEVYLEQADPEILQHREC